MIELIFAGIALTVCVALLLRMALPGHLRQRVDELWRLAAQLGRLLAHRAWFWIRYRKRAAREAEEAIQRAQHKVKRDGNVIRPDDFKGPRKPH